MEATLQIAAPGSAMPGAAKAAAAAKAATAAVPPSAAFRVQRAMSDPDTPPTAKKAKWLSLLSNLDETEIISDGEEDEELMAMLRSPPPRPPRADAQPESEPSLAKHSHGDDDEDHYRRGGGGGTKNMLVPPSGH